jgi:hypothetical protein
MSLFERTPDHERHAPFRLPGARPIADTDKTGNLSGYQIAQIPRNHDKNGQIQMIIFKHFILFVGGSIIRLRLNLKSSFA